MSYWKFAPSAATPSTAFVMPPAGGKKPMDEQYQAGSGPNPHRPDYGEEGPLFSLGRILATPGALAACEQAAANPVEYISRHVFGDWGDLGEEDKRANDKALELGARILSAYDLPTEERIWVITEWDRSVTTVLLPSEY